MENDTIQKLRLVSRKAPLPLSRWLLLLLGIVFVPTPTTTTTATFGCSYYMVVAAFQVNRCHQQHQHLLRPPPRPSSTLPRTPRQRVVSFTSSSSLGMSDTSHSINDGNMDDSTVEVNESVTTSTVTTDATATTTTTTTNTGGSMPQRWYRSIVSMYQPRDTSLTFRQRLAKMGLATILSYGFVSNMSYAVTVSCAWYIHNVKHQLSPLAPGQYKPFLLIYSGFWIFNNVVRPIRLGVSLAVVAPQCDKILNYIQMQYRVSRTVAIAVTVFLANVVGTISAMSLGIILASILSGVPIFP